MHSSLICIRIMHKIFLNSTLVLHIILHTLVWILARVLLIARVARALSWKKYICMHTRVATTLAIGLSYSINTIHNIHTTHELVHDACIYMHTTSLEYY